MQIPITLTLAAVHACAHLQAQPALPPSRGTQHLVHASVLYPQQIVLVPITLTLAAVLACAHLQAQLVLPPSLGTQHHVHASVL